MAGPGQRVSLQSTPHGRRQNAAYRAYMLLRFAIKTGGLPTGMLVEERSIMEGFGFSRSAVRDALSELRTAGLVDRKTGVGTTIRIRPLQIALLDVVPLARDQTISLRLTETYHIGESRYLAMRLGTDERADLTMSEFYLTAGGTPVGVLSAFTAGPIRGTSMLRPAWQMPTLAEAFPAQYGVEFGSMDVSIDARLADPELAEVLGIDSGAAILAREQVMRDADGVAWEYAFVQYRADQVVLQSTTTDPSSQFNWVEEFTHNKY